MESFMKNVNSASSLHSLKLAYIPALSLTLSLLLATGRSTKSVKQPFDYTNVDRELIDLMVSNGSKVKKEHLSYLHNRMHYRTARK